MAHACQASRNTRSFQNRRFFNTFVIALLGLLVFSPIVYCQVETATISGVITDQSGAVVAAAEVRVINTDTNGTWIGISNGAGVYLVTALKPGRYRIHVGKEGFKGIDLSDLILNVQDSVSRNFTLQVGSTSESISVEGNALQINTQDAAVSTVVDRQFAENLPMNGRSFQTLIQLTPGVVLTTSTQADAGQFSVNGQRAASNYWTVDGVSANIGVNANVPSGNGVGGSLGSFSVFGGTNSLVSVDALQEFRIQTSTYAPEFGRTPGGQISIATRSGANQLHGTLFDYLRNDLFDANNWFADSKGLPKPQERQNDFGGTFSGPMFKDRTFFFFSYEGLRLRLPQTALTGVPDVAARQNAIPSMQPFLNAFPLPNGMDNAATGVAQFNASYSNPATLDAYSLRIDHKLSSKINLFGRYNYSPSEISQRGQGGIYPLNTVTTSRFTTQTGTLGFIWSGSPIVANDFRFNYSRAEAHAHSSQDNFGGAIPLSSLPLPSPFTSNDSFFGLDIFSLQQGFMVAGELADNLQRQINVVDNLSVQKGSHSLKVGIDFRRLSPITSPNMYSQQALFFNVPSAQNGQTFFALVTSQRKTELLFHNLGVFAQDTWRIVPRLTLTYGLRWDTDFTPSSNSGPSLPAVTGFNLNDFSTLALAPAGTSPFNTTYENVAPRIGLAWQLSQSQDWERVVRGGFGVFYDLATQEVGNLISASYPFGGQARAFGATFPLDSMTAAPPPITAANLTSPSAPLLAFDPKLKLPYTLQWNVGLEQALGRQQSFTASYVGSTGRRLIQTAQIISPNPSFGSAQLVANTATSDYDALQLQFQRRLSRGLQVLASYTWSHSIDSASAGSGGNSSNSPSSGVNFGGNRGSSDFDIRHAFSAAVTYDVPAPRLNAFANLILRGWSLQSVIQVRSAPPVDIIDGVFNQLSNGFNPNIRPDLVPGVPLYLYGPQYPGGKAFNNTLATGACPDGSDRIGPFCSPPSDVNGNAVRQGNLGRNALRAFGATQWDFAVHRDFPIHESLKLQFRAEMFNVLNHPNFGPPDGNLSDSQFGLSTQMLGQSLGGQNSNNGGFTPLYQIGGPRSIQLALKLIF